MARDDRAAAVQPDNEIARRVHRYERALFAVLELRPDEERTKPITNEEHLLAAQAAEAVTAYERCLRHTPVPTRKDAAEDADAVPRPVKARRKPAPAPVRRRKRARRKAPQKPAAAPQEG